MYQTLIAAIAALALGFGSGWATNGWRLGAEISHIKEQAATNLTNSLQEALKETTQYQRKKDEAIKRAQSSLADRDTRLSAADSELKRMQQLLSESATNIPRATHDSLVKHATTLSTVYQECGRELKTLGGNAEGHTIDIQTLTASFPVKKETK